MRGRPERAAQTTAPRPPVGPGRVVAQFPATTTCPPRSRVVMLGRITGHGIDYARTGRRETGVKDWEIANLDSETIERIHRLERELGVVLIAWKNKS